MQNDSKSYCGVMEDGGACNKHAKLQPGGAALVLPLFEGAVRNLALDGGNQPVVIADYGSSQAAERVHHRGKADHTNRDSLINP